MLCVRATIGGAVLLMALSVAGPVHADPSGPVYLSESVVMVDKNTNQWMAARWIPAGPLFTKWLHGP